MKLIKSLFSKIIKTLGTLSFILILGVIFTTFGYKAINQETKVADIYLKPNGNQQFEATIDWVDGTKSKFNISGDQLYIDAKILKWKSWASIIGIKTWYEFDRIGGRYVEINDERTKDRSVYQLSKDKDYDLYNIRKKYPMLSFMVDSEYGSAAFFMADVPKKIELSVSRTGLTISSEDNSIQSDQPPKLKVD